MFKLNNLFSLIFFAAAGVLTATSGSLAAPARPNPPLLCVDGSPDCEPTPTIPGSGVKWRPGHGIKTQGQPCRSDQSAYFDSITNQFSLHLESSKKLKNAYVQYAWGALEPTKGNYNWTPVRRHLDWLAARSKVMIVSIQPKCFGGITNPEHIAPDDLENEVETTATGIFMRVWDPKVMDRAIIFMKAFAREFDSHPALEAVGWQGENCPSWSGDQPADWTALAYATQLQRMYSALSDSFSQTMTFAPINCSPGDTAPVLFEEIYKMGLGRRSPDTYDDGGQRRFRGEMDALRDYRGYLPHLTVVSAPDLGGRNDITPLTNIQSNHINRSKITHVSWVLTSKNSGATKADIIKHIETPGNETATACPGRVTEQLGGCKN